MAAIEIQTAEDFAGMRRAGRVVAECFALLDEFIAIGMQTSEIDERVRKFCREQKVWPAPLNYRGYPSSVCVSINEVICHGIPGEYRLREGDIMNVDLTFIVDGYHGDASKMYCMGKVSDAATDLVRVTRECLGLGLAAVVAGGHFGDIGAAIQQHAHKHRYGVVRDFCGHGLGRKFHMPPSVLHYRAARGQQIRPGMIFTVEPMINARGWESKMLGDEWTAITRDGSLSAQFEHSIGVLDDGIEIFTAGVSDKLFINR